MKDHKPLYLIMFLLAALVLGGRIPVKERLQPQVAAAAPLEAGTHPRIAAAPHSGPGFISIPPVAFRPEQDGYDFYIPGHAVSPGNQFSPNYYAAVYLPHGATVNKLTCYWRDWAPTFDASCELLRMPMNGTFYETMASAYSSGSSGNVTSSDDTTITSPVVDNSQYSYIVHWYLPWESGNPVYGQNVLIEYGFYDYLPLTSR